MDDPATLPGVSLRAEIDFCTTPVFYRALNSLVGVNWGRVCVSPLPFGLT